VMNKICITMERNGLERRSGTFSHKVQCTCYSYLVQACGES